MTKSELWKQIAARNPSFDGDGNITLPAAGLRKLFELVWNKAYDDGFERGRVISDKLHKAVGNKDKEYNSMDAFNGIFGDAFKKK